MAQCPHCQGKGFQTSPCGICLSSLQAAYSHFDRLLDADRCADRGTSGAATSLLVDSKTEIRGAEDEGEGEDSGEDIRGGEKQQRGEEGSEEVEGREDLDERADSPVR